MTGQTMIETELDDVESAAFAEDTQHEGEQTLEDAISQEMGFVDAGTKDEVPDTTALDEAGASPEKSVIEDGGGAKDETMALTDADLEPLGSKNQSTNDRFRKVTEGYKHVAEENVSLKAQVEQANAAFESLRSLGFTDESAANDLVEFAQYRHVLATGDADQFQAMIARQIRAFESQHGRRVAVQASALDDYPDLRQKIDDLTIDEDTAMELARSRALTQRIQREQQQAAQRRKADAASDKAVNAAVAEVEALQQHWQQTDADFAAILPHLQADLADIGRQYPASQWASMVAMNYKAIKRALVAQSDQQRATTTPLRSGGRVATKPEPASLHEAVAQAMGFDD